MMRLLAILPLIIVLALSGCGGGDSSNTTSTDGSSGSGGEGGGDWTVRDTGVGPLELGMTEAELKEAAVGAEVLPVAPAPEGLKDPVLELRRSGKAVGYAELKDGKVWRFTAEDAVLMTSYGASAGTTASTLGPLYGTPALVKVNGKPAVRFETSPNYRFVFQKPASAKTVEDLGESPVWRIQIAEDWPRGQ